MSSSFSPSSLPPLPHWDIPPPPPITPPTNPFSSSPPSYSSTGETYSNFFPLYPEADLVVQTSDNLLFATRSLFLRAASSSFDNVLSLPIPPNHETRDGLVLLKIDEQAEVFKVFLLFAHRDGINDRVGAVPKPSQPSWPTLLLLSTFLHKHDSPILTRTILTEYLLPVLEPTNVVVRQQPVVVFAVASIHGLEEICKQALRVCGEITVQELEVVVDDGVVKEEEEKVGGGGGEQQGVTRRTTTKRYARAGCIGDVPTEILAKMPLKHVVRYAMLHARVMAVPEYTWSMAGDDFKL